MTQPSDRRGTLPRPVLVLGAAALVGAGLMPAASAAAAPLTIDVVAITDYHGRLETSNEVGGASVLAGAVEQLRTANPNTVFVSSGDNIGASTFTSFIQEDEPTLDVLTDMDLFTSAIGNHELDGGRADLDERVIPFLEADNPFSYLAANLYDTATGAPAYDEYALAEFGDVTVGFIGAVTEDLESLVSPAGIATLEVRPIVTEVARVADELSDGVEANGEADVTVALIHEGAASAAAVADPGTAFGEIVTGLAGKVDAISGGHTHVQLATVGTGLEGRNGLPLAVIQAGEYSEAIGRLSITVDDATGDLQAITASVQQLRTGTPGPNNTTVWTSNFPADAEVQKKVDAAVAVAKELGSEPVGEITADLNRARQADGAENRGGESTLGNFVAEVQRWSTGAEIGFMNPGGLRANLSYAAGSGATNGAGVVTYEEAALVQPFANTLVTMDLTGEQLRTVLEQQWQPSTASRPFLKLGVSEGFEYTYDPAAPAGSRISDMFLDGVLIADTDTFRVVANSFLASGGDNFGGFSGGTARADSGKVDLESQVDYFEEFGAVSPPTDQRSVGVSLATDTVQQGGSLSLQLSSLLFSAGETNPTTVDVLLGETVVGSATIDPTIVSTTDEVGRATVEVSIPQTAPTGEVSLTVRTAAGTEIAVPITVTELPAPEAPAEEDLVELPKNEDVVDIPAEAEVGGTVTVQIEGHEGEVVFGYLYSEPVYLGSAVVTDGQVTFAIPADATPGTHLLAVLDAQGEVLGWDEIVLVAAAVEPTPAPTPAPAPGGGGLAATGLDARASALGGVVALLALLAGAALLVVRRRRA